MKRQEKKGGRVFLSFQGSFYGGLRFGPEPLPCLYCQIIRIRGLSHGNFITNPKQVPCISNKTFIQCSLICLVTVCLWNGVKTLFFTLEFAFPSTILKRWGDVDDTILHIYI